MAGESVESRRWKWSCVLTSVIFGYCQYQYILMPLAWTRQNILRSTKCPRSKGVLVRVGPHMYLKTSRHIHSPIVSSPAYELNKGAFSASWILLGQLVWYKWREQKTHTHNCQKISLSVYVCTGMCPFLYLLYKDFSNQHRKMKKIHHKDNLWHLDKLFFST